MTLYKSKLKKKLLTRMGKKANIITTDKYPHTFNSCPAKPIEHIIITGVHIKCGIAIISSCICCPSGNKKLTNYKISVKQVL